VRGDDILILAIDNSITDDYIFYVSWLDRWNGTILTGVVLWVVVWLFAAGLG
jgi:hypothetical protein